MHGPASTATMPVKRIKVGKRHRRDLGDVGGLAASIAEVGLLHPVVVRPDGKLIAGERRLRACKQLGWTDVPVTVVNLDEIVRGEFAENAHRKDFLPSEAVAIKRALEPIERAAAKARQGARTDQHPEKFSRCSAGRALDKIATATGLHRTTLAKAEAIVDAARAEPEKYGRFLDNMDRTGRVNGVYRRLKVAKHAELLRAEPVPLPGNGPYHVIVADVPWPNFGRDDVSRRGMADITYPTMTLDEINAMNVGSLAHDDCILWLWTTNAYMRTPSTLRSLGDSSRGRF